MEWVQHNLESVLKDSFKSKQTFELPIHVLLKCLRNIEKDTPEILELIRLSSDYDNGYFEIGMFPILEYKKGMVRASQVLQNHPIQPDSNAISNNE